MVKSGTKPRKLKRRLLSHEDKRQVAKAIVTGAARKVVAAAFKISVPTVYTISREYVITIHKERYPDQKELLFHPKL